MDIERLEVVRTARDALHLVVRDLWSFRHFLEAISDASESIRRAIDILTDGRSSQSGYFELQDLDEALEGAGGRPHSLLLQRVMMQELSWKQHIVHRSLARALEAGTKRLELNSTSWRGAFLNSLRRTLANVYVGVIMGRASIAAQWSRLQLAAALCLGGCDSVLSSPSRLAGEALRRGACESLTAAR